MCIETSLDSDGHSQSSLTPLIHRASGWRPQLQSFRDQQSNGTSSKSQQHNQEPGLPSPESRPSPSEHTAHCGHRLQTCWGDGSGGRGPYHSCPRAPKAKEPGNTHTEAHHHTEATWAMQVEEGERSPPLRCVPGSAKRSLHASSHGGPRACPHSSPGWACHR